MQQFTLVGQRNYRGSKVIKVYAGADGQCLVVRDQKNNNLAWCPDHTPAEFMATNDIPKA